MDIDPAWMERGLAVVAIAIANGTAKFIAYARKRDRIHAAIEALHDGAERFKKLEAKFEEMADGVYRRLGRLEKRLTPEPYGPEPVTETKKPGGTP